MKKQTQKVVMTLIIVVLLSMSTISFVVLSRLPEEKNAEDIPNPTKYVVNDYLNETLKQVYLSRGYTLMEYNYYDGCCGNISQYIDFLPDTVGNQLIVQKIQGSEYYINIESIIAREDKITPNNNRELLISLCRVLVKAPIECGLIVSTNGTIN